MDKSKYKRLLKLDPKKYRDLVKRLNADSHYADSRRGRDRIEYPAENIPLQVKQPEGGEGWFVVYGINVSRQGMGVLHGGYTHTGSKCRVLLRRVTGKPIAVSGVVMHCRLLQGSCHALGIRFDEEIDPTDLLPAEDYSQPTSTDKPSAVGSVGTLVGRILYAESFPPDRVLLEHQLTLLNLRVTCVATSGAALDAVRRYPFDMVINGLHHTVDHGLELIQKIRNLGLQVPIVMLSSDIDPEIQMQAGRAGVTEILVKPANPDILLAQLHDHLGTANHHQALYSTASEQPGMTPLIAQFVRYLRQATDLLEQSLSAHDTDRLHELCFQLKGSGSGYGFQLITVKAIRVLNVLQDNPSPNQLRPVVESLIKLCRLASHDQPANSAA